MLLGCIFVQTLPPFAAPIQLQSHTALHHAPVEGDDDDVQTRLLQLPQEIKLLMHLQSVVEPGVLEMYVLRYLMLETISTAVPVMWGTKCVFRILYMYI